jgi:plasmid stabilization system protein ParE
MRVLFRPEAKAEVLEAKAWYEAHVPGLGFEFARALEASVQSAVRMPLAHPTLEGSCRRVLMRRFPFSVIYLPGEESILVVAVFHHHREPGSWLGRVGG